MVSRSQAFQAILFFLVASPVLVLAVATQKSGGPRRATEAEMKAATQKHVEEAKKFLAGAEAKLLEVGVEAARADWVKSTYITEDTQLLAAKADERSINATVQLAKQATRFDGLRLPGDLARKLKLLKLSLTLATPSDPKESEELTEIVSSLEGTYGKGKWCPPGQEKCLDIEDITRLMATSRDPQALRDAWLGWHAISRPMRKDFSRYVELANKGGANSDLRTMALCGAPSTICLRKSFPANWSACGTRSVLFTSPCTPTSEPGCGRNMATRWFPRMAPYRLTCWATCGPRSGATSTRWWPRATPTRATTSPPSSKAGIRTPYRWCAMASVSSPPLVSRPCPRLSGSDPSSSSPGIATWCATPAPGTLTT